MPKRASSAAPSTGAPPHLAFVALLIFVSGASALVFQVAWMRELRLVFGATTAASAAVLAVFMAGLGVGSALLGKKADHVPNPLRLYGVLEAGVALSAAATPWLIALASSVYITLGGQHALGLSTATTARLALTAIVLVVPTFLMGGTLPAAVRAVTGTSDIHRRALGVLYGCNTLGAVFGAAAATFFALEHLGTRATLWTGCAGSLLAGAMAVARSRKLSPMTVRGEEPPPLVPEKILPATNAEEPLHAKLELPPRWIYLTAALLGFTFFALELVWYRMLGPILGGTAFTFGLILCVALFGIGAGGMAYHVLFRWWRPTWSALAVTCGLEALFIMVPYALGDWIALRAAWHAQSAMSFANLVFGWTLLTSLVVLPAALVSGVQFPLLTALLGSARTAVSKHLGMTYAWNTAGAIAGSLIAGFGGIPLLTAPGMWRAIGVLLAMLSLGIIFAASRPSRRAVFSVACLALVTVGLAWLPGPTAVWRHSGIGAGRAVVPPESDRNGVRHWLNERRHVIVWEADGIESSIGIDAGNGLAFIVNGKNDGNALGDAATQIGVSALAAVLHQDPQTALVIGLGTGESAGWLADMRNVRRVDVVELEPAIDEIAFRARDVNRDVLNHPRVRRIYDDGREFLFTTRNQYDLVISEPSNPYRAGIAALYTSEFYQQVRKRLNPGGLFIQWLQAYEVDEATVNTVLATVASAFEHVEVWQTIAPDLQLVCSNTPLRHSPDALRERLASPVVRDALAKAWHVRDFEGFLGRFVANERWARSVKRLPFVPPNTDDRTTLEYAFAKTVGRQTLVAVEVIRDQLRAAGFHRPVLDDASIDWNLVEIRRQEFNMLFDGQLTYALLPDTDDQSLIKALAEFRDSNFQGALELWPARHREPSDDIQRLVLARCYAELARPECLELIAAAEPRYPSEAAALRTIYHWKQGNATEAAAAMEAFIAQLARNPWLIPDIAASGLSLAKEIAKQRTDFAQRLFDQLERPFAGHRFNYQRAVARVHVARELGPERIVEALSEFEPHVPWTADILEARAQAYAAVNHPLAARAARDWQWFQRHQPAK